MGLVLFIITYLSHPISTFWRWDETCRSPPHMRAMDGPSLGSNAAWKILLGIVCSLPFSSMKMAIYGGISVFPISDKKHIMSCWTNVRSVSHLYLRIGCLNPIYISKKAPCFNHPIFSPQKNSNIPQNHVVFDIACWYPYSITIYIPWYCHSPLYGELYIPVLQVVPTATLRMRCPRKLQRSHWSLRRWCQIASSTLDGGTSCWEKVMVILGDI